MKQVSTNIQNSKRSLLSKSKELTLLFVALVLLMNTSRAQTSVQNFGTGTGSHTSATGSTSFLPNPTSGTTWARGNTAGGSVNLVNTTNLLGSTGSFVRAVAPTATSVTKFSPWVGYSSGTEFYTSFKVLFGDVSGGNTATSGVWSFYQGAGAMYSDANNFSGAQVFAGLTFTYGAGGVVALTTRQGSSTVNTGISPSTFNQGTVYTIELVGNNKASGTINYTYNGGAQSVAVQKLDIYVNGTLIANDIPEAAMTAGTAIVSGTWIGVSSASNVANVFVDDAVTYNAVPSAIGSCTPPVISLNTATDPTCFGATNGSITLNASGATSFSWSNGATTQDISVVGAGTYTVTATSTPGCTATLSQTLTEPSQIVINAGSNSPICTGSDLNLTSSPTGGSGSYTTYAWTGPNTFSSSAQSPTITGATSAATGSYTVTVTDATGCTNSQTISATVNDVPTISFSPIAPAFCAGSSVSVTASGSTGFTWSPATGLSATTGASVIASPSATTTYTVSESGSSCAATATVTVTVNDNPSASCAATNVTVLNGNDGTATVTPSGGNGVYTYSWTNTAQTTAAIAGLSVNSYVATVTDGNGCTATCTSVVGQPVNALAVSCSVLSNVTCNGGTDGSATVSASGGTGPYTYLWSNGATTATISGVVAGTYSVTVTDAASAVLTCSSTITEPSAISVTSSANSPLCTGGNINLNGTVSGGVSPYTFSWSGPNTYSSTSLSNTISAATTLDAGDYTLTVTDASGCTASSTSNVVVNQASVSVSPTSASVCEGTQTTLTASGASTYDWSPAAGLSATSGATVDASPSTSTTYTVVGTDANGCTASATTSITVASLNLAISPASYTLLTGRSVTLTTSGTATSYLWSTTETTSSITVSPTTTTSYTVTATDGSCTSSSVATITVVNSYLAGNIIVERAGDGVAALSTSSAPVFLDEYNVGTSTLVKTTAIPTTGGNRLVIAGSSGTEGMVTRSSNNQALVLAGYDAAAAVATIASTTSAVAPRVVSIVDYAQNIIRTATTTSFSGGSFRSASSDGLKYYGTGSITGTLLLGTSGAATTIQSTLTNTRVVNIFNNQLYVSTGAGTTRGVYKIGTGLPTTSTTATLFISSGATGSTSNYAINAASNVAYLADDAAAGINKYTFNGTNWVLAYTIPTGGISTRGLIVDFSATNPIIYGTSTESVGNRLFKIVDIGASSTLVNIATAGTNMSFKGVSFAPECPSASKPTITVNSVTPACVGGTNGAIDISATGGNAPYAYTWSNGTSSEDASGLAPNTYTVSVMDNSGCSNFTSVTVNSIAAPSPSISGTTSICAGGSTMLDAGAGYSSYLWSPGGETTQTISATATGSYTVTVTNASGCSASATVTVGQFASPTPTISGNTTFCTGGSVLLDAGAGYSSYLWSTSETTQTITVNTAGTYTVTVTNSNGCTGSASVDVTLVAGLTPTITGNLSYCQGGSTTLSVGLGYDSYLWSTTETTPSITVTAGTYTVTVSSGACTGSASVIVVENPTPTVSITPTSASICLGQSVSLTADGAATYEWAPSTGLSSTTDVVVSATPSATTTYTVVGTDGNGCTASSTVEVTILPVPTVTVSPVNQAFCSGTPATIDASGADSYIWSPATGLDVTTGATVVSTVSSTTVYTVTGTIANGCTASATSTVIIIPTFPAPSAQTSYTYCLNAPATPLTATASSSNSTLLWYTVPTGGTSSTTAPTPSTSSNGTQDYYVSEGESSSSIKIAITGMIDNGTPDLFSFVALTSIPAGTNIYFTDNGWRANNIFNGASVTDLSGTEAICKFTAVLPISAGTVIQSYSTSLGYTWTTSGKINPAGAVSSGNNQYAPLDLATAGDQVYAFLSTNDNDPLNNPTTHLYVFDSSNGFEAATTSNEGAIPPGLSIGAGTAVTMSHYNYYNLINDDYIRSVSQWYQYTADTTLNYTKILGANSGLPALGSTSFKIAAACESPRTHITVTVQGPIPAAGSNSPVCAGGEIHLFADLDYNYNVSWTGPNSFTSTDQEPPAISPATSAEAGDYIVTATDVNGCTASQTVTVVVSQVVATAVETTPILCNGGTATITVTGSGGTAPYSGEGTFTVSAGTYNYTLTDANGCIGSTSITVTEPTALSATSSATTIVCFGGSSTVTVSAAGGTSPYTGTGSFTVGAGTYTYTVTDANGCTATTSITVTEPAQIVVTATETSSIVCPGGNATITVSAAGGDGNYTGTGTFTVTAGTYNYNVTDGNGCSGSASITVADPAAVGVSSFTPTSGCVGSTVSILGSNLNLVTAIDLNGISAIFVLVNSGEITVTVPPTATSGVFNLFTASNCVTTTASSYTVTTCSTGMTINLKAYLQGYYIGGGTMEPVLANQSIVGATGAETDTIQVEIYDENTFLLAGSTKAILMTDGTCTAVLNGADGNYYVAIRQRNHILTWSAISVTMSAATPASYDFSTDPSQAMSGDLSDKYSEGIYSFFVGDLNQDEFVDGNDYPQFDTDNSLGLCCDYYATDMNGDGFVDGNDYPQFDTNNSLGIGSVHP